MKNTHPKMLIARRTGWVVLVLHNALTVETNFTTMTHRTCCNTSHQATLDSNRYVVAGGVRSFVLEDVRLVQSWTGLIVDNASLLQHSHAAMGETNI